jgi:glycosyltransferase involved in cell wall biosynthesis
MACKVPVISSNSGGLPEVNVEGVSGYLSKVGDLDDMALKAVKILENKETLAQFKHNAYAVAKKYDIQYILPMYEELYQKAIATHPVL